MADLWLAGHALYKLISDFLRISIKNSDPSNAIELTKLIEKLWQCLTTIDIFTIYCGLLGYKNKLLYTILSKLLSLS